MSGLPCPKIGWHIAKSAPLLPHAVAPTIKGFFTLPLRSNLTLIGPVAAHNYGTQKVPMSNVSSHLRLLLAPIYHHTFPFPCISGRFFLRKPKEEKKKKKKIVGGGGGVDPRRNHASPIHPSVRMHKFIRHQKSPVRKLAQV